MDIQQIINEGRIYTDPTHPRKSCTLCRDRIICHPADVEKINFGLQGFFVSRDEQRRIDENPTSKKIFDMLRRDG